MNTTSEHHWHQSSVTAKVMCPDVSYKPSRTLSVDGAMGVDGHHIEITFVQPVLAGWMRPREANAGGDEGR
ncbi:hypothetical protein [Haladaptatus litoreus]|nr:hypothetical protein [Haladaptatus litoreus]